MIGIHDILKLKTLILTLNTTIAISIIIISVWKNTISNTITNKENAQKQTDNNKENQKPSIAGFQAITPVIQSYHQLEITLSERFATEFQVIKKKTIILIQKASKKIFKILFRLIISPNAP